MGFEGALGDTCLNPFCTTLQMLLVAKKPSYKTLYTLKYSSGLKAFPVPRDQNGEMIHSHKILET